MDRALDPDLLQLALGEADNLPSPDELSQLLAEAELALLLNDPSVSDELTDLGWYLHAIASSHYSLQEYGIERQRAAFQVSAHIFDLKLKTINDDFEKLKIGFGSQIAYLRSELDPNSLAIYRREFSGLSNNSYSILTEPQEISLVCAVALLGFDVGFIFDLTEDLLNEISVTEDKWDIDEIAQTPFGSSSLVVNGIRQLMSFLVYGNSRSLELAKNNFSRSIQDEYGYSDDISRWIAAHLINIVDDLAESSMWSIMPPDLSPSIQNAFIFGKPRVLTLWPPQVEVLSDSDSEPNILSDKTNRLVITSPTSGGKTLLAQLVVASHLIRKKTAVCYVAPSRSLCREIRSSLDSRLRHLDVETNIDLENQTGLEDLLGDVVSEVQVMTPERLSYLLRNDSEALLNSFGLFVFDEVHHVGDGGRGWKLEETIAFLHHATVNSDHKIALLSAAIGNQLHFVNWIRSEESDENTHIHKDIRWRGPRRLHAIFTSEADWDNKKVEERRSPEYPTKEIMPLYGVLHTRISHTGEVRRLTTNEPVGKLVLRVHKDNSDRQKINESTAFYKLQIPIIKHLAKFGPVLVIETTKAATLRMAKALAEDLDNIESIELQPLLDLVEARLSKDHPLWSILNKGVGYHHGSLPREIRLAIENAVINGEINHLVATTTLADGVNLPVQSVIISSQGFTSETGYVEYLKGPKLLNAIGRAGRATKESEGYVVLARNASFDLEDFNRLEPSSDDLQIESMLVSAQALESLAAFEELINLGEDAVFLTNRGRASEFLSFIWFLAAELEKSKDEPTDEKIQEVLQRSLGWVQATEEVKARWLKAANACLLQFNNTPKESRIKWASSQSSLNTSRIIEDICNQIYGQIEDIELPTSVADVIKLIISDGRLERILALPEAPKLKLYNRRQVREQIEVPFEQFLQDWVSGVELKELANTYLSIVEDIEYRYEQLGDFITDYFQNYLPWIFGTIIKWTNSLLEENSIEQSILTTVPTNIRWGVDNHIALELMAKGIQSRVLAMTISNIWIQESTDMDVWRWIRDMDLADWENRFGASISELRNLLEFSRSRKASTTARLLNNKVTEVSVSSDVFVLDEIGVVLKHTSDLEIYPIGIYHNDEFIGHIFAKDQYDINSIMNLGLSILITYTSPDGEPKIKFELLDTE